MLITGAIKNGIPRIGLKQIGVPKIIGSLILQMPGIIESLPVLFNFTIHHKNTQSQRITRTT